MVVYDISAPSVCLFCVLFCGSIRIIEFALSAFPLTSCEYTQLRQDPLHSGSTAQILRDMTTAVPLLWLSGIGPI